MIRHILIPLDGSPFAEVLLDPLTGFARRLGASLTLLRIIDDGPLVDGAHPALRPSIERAIAGATAAASAYLDALRERLRPSGVAVDAIIASGAPGVVIVRLARERHADLVALTRRSVPKPEAATIGTVATQVLHTAPLPLLIFPAPEATPLPSPDAARLLVPLDGSAAGEAALDTALPLALDLGAAVTLLRVLPDLRFGLYDAGAVAMPPAAGTAWRAAEDHALAYLGERSLKAATAGVAAQPAVVHGDAPDQIIDAAAVDAGTIIVMSTYSRSGPRDYALGSVTARVVRDARNPVLVVPREPGTPRVLL